MWYVLLLDCVLPVEGTISVFFFFVFFSVFFSSLFMFVLWQISTPEPEARKASTTDNNGEHLLHFLLFVRNVFFFFLLPLFIVLIM